MVTNSGRVENLYVNFRLRLLRLFVAVTDHYASNSDKRMNNLRPVDLHDPEIKARSSSMWTTRRDVIGLLFILIIVVMVAWFGFLGWGMLEILRLATAYTKKLWTMLP